MREQSGSSRTYPFQHCDAVVHVREPELVAVRVQQDSLARIRAAARRGAVGGSGSFVKLGDVIQEQEGEFARFGSGFGSAEGPEETECRQA